MSAKVRIRRRQEVRAWEHYDLPLKKVEHSLRHKINLIAQEGAYGTRLLEHDITDSPIMFGKNRVVKLEKNHIGFGLLF